MTGLEYMSFLEQITNIDSTDRTAFMLAQNNMSKEERLKTFKSLSHSTEGFAEAAMAVGAYYNMLRHSGEPISSFDESECDFLINILSQRIKPVITNASDPNYGMNRGWNSALYRSIEILKSMC